MKKVGLPRALLYYKFSKLWMTFFKDLGAEVIVSPPTNKCIKDEAIRISPNEDCYSTKLYFGHVMNLRDKVDYLFIPRFGSYRKKKVGCPKFLGLAEVLKSMFPDLPTIIKPHYNVAMGRDTKISLFFKAFKVGLIITKNPFKIINAIIHALRIHKKHTKELVINEANLHRWERNELFLNDLPNLKKGERMLKIALVGHSYVINDPISSLNIRDILKKSGVDIITSEQMPRELIEIQMKKLLFDMYFEYERELLGTILHFLESKTIDGIIQLLVFSCGPDSVAGEMALRYSKRNPTIPLLQLVFDELTSKTGLKTRIEAFLDMLKRDSAKQYTNASRKVHV